MQHEGQGLVGENELGFSATLPLLEPCASKVQPVRLEAVALQVTKKYQLPFFLPSLQVCSLGLEGL